MTTRKDDIKPKEIPDIIVDPGTHKRYMKGKFLGKGGFAKCYELTDMETKQIYAGKCVAKSLLTKPHQKEKMTQEINIHRSVSHKHIVGFFSFFEDSDFVYILLELCRRRSLMELHKRRRAVTEPECRYFVRQILLACIYLHEGKIIHRDLKLGNLFLDDEMHIKIGDFGLATKLDYDGERKKTLCGTPNYIAPEVLGKKGHSYEVDVWSLGCIVYTLLVGKPPFETSNLKDTYTRIKKNEYHIPSTRVSPAARNLITRLLRQDPTCRPSMTEILADDFFSAGYLPVALPTSCLTMAPRFDMLKAQTESVSTTRKPLLELNDPAQINTRKDSEQNKKESQGDVVTKTDELRRPASGDDPSDYYLSDLFSQLSAMLATRPAERPIIAEDEAEDPAGVPIYWVSKWVDYSDKYGLGYQLCDNSVGVLFNDSTRLILTSHADNIQYIERDGKEYFHNLRVFPEALTKKVTLLKYFRNYMSEHLLKAGANMLPREGDELVRLPFLRTWFRTRSAIVLHLSNGTMQINFFQDHTKIIVCPLMSAATYIDEKREFKTYRLNLIEQYGCTRELASRLRYARTMVERLMNPKSGSGKVKSTS